MSNLYVDKDYSSEEKALKETILEANIRGENVICLFDRGAQARAFYDELTRRGIFFITRLKKGYKSEVIEEHLNPKSSGRLELTKEVEAYFFHKKKKKTEFSYRIIHGDKSQFTKAERKAMEEDERRQVEVWNKLQRQAHKRSTKEELLKASIEEEVIFVTNIPADTMSAEEVAQQYRKMTSCKSLNCQKK